MVGLSIGDVFALYDPPKDPNAGWVEHRVEVTEEDVRGHLHMRAGARTMWVNPTHADWVLGLQDRGVEVVWASRWGQLANQKIAPLLSLDPLPCITDRYPPRLREGGQDWVYRALRTGYSGRPTIWVAHDAEAYDTGARGRRVTVSTRSGVGLEAAEMEQVEGFIDRWI